MNEYLQAGKVAELAQGARDTRPQDAEETAAGGRWEWSLVDDAHTWSDQLYRIYGRHPKLGPAPFPALQRYHTAEGWRLLSTAVRSCLVDARPYVCDVEVVRPDGERRWVTARGKAVLGADGSMIKLEGSIEDITDRKRAGLTSPADQRATIAQRSAVRFDGSRILLVDDDAINRELVHHLLSAFGLRVAKANDGREAVENARHNRYATVLMAIQMPRMDGLQATRLLRTLPGWHDVPIVAMTAHAFADQRKACLAAGMNDLVAKPVGSDALVETLMRWLPVDPDDEYGSENPAKEPAHRDADGSAVLQRLGKMPGFDLARGLRMLLGRSDRFLELLHCFIAGHLADPDAMRTALENGDPETAHRLAHSLKGTAAILGAFAVADAAEQLDKYFMAGDAEAGPALARRLASLAAALDALSFLVADQAPAAMAHPGQVASIVAHPELRDLMRRYLVAGDIRAVDLFASDSERMRGMLGQRFDHFSNALRRFEYEAALLILDRQAEGMALET